MTKTWLLASAGMGLLMACAGQAQASGPWTGVYLGGHAGGAWLDADMTKTAEGSGGLPFDSSLPGTTLGFSPNGVAGGAQIGYLYQFDNIVMGVELSGSYSDLDETRIDPDDLDNSRALNADWNASLAMRAGYAFGDTLAYVKGGLALARFEHTLFDDVVGGDPSGQYSTSEDHDGWTLGAGVEHLLSPDVSVALAYDYYDFGSKDHVAKIGAASVTRELDPEIQTVTVRLNWHFMP